MFCFILYSPCSQDELREKARKIRQLTEQLESKSSPLGAGARAAAAHSEMKLRTKRAESVRKLERATTRCDNRVYFLPEK